MRNHIIKICHFLFINLFIYLNVYSQIEPVIKSGPYLSDVTKTSIIIAWQTDTTSSSAVEYGLTTNYEFEVIDTNRVTIHAIQLTNLLPSTTYHYRIKSDSVVSEDNIIQTAVTWNEDFEFVAYGDTRTNHDDHRSVVQRIITLNPKIILNTGDLVEFGRLQSEWDIYFDIIKDLAKNTPIYVSIGNHEEEHALYYDQHFLPHNNPDSTEKYYSFDYGRCHFISLNANLSVPYEPGSAQYMWLENDLKAAASSDFIIVFFHYPPYSSTNPVGGNLSVRDAFCPLLEKYGVDIVINGHDHNYERTYPINGITYVITGGGGAPLKDIVKTGSWSAYAEKTLHCVKLFVTDEFIKFWMIKPDSSIGDSAYVLGPNATVIRNIDEDHDYSSMVITAYYIDDRNANGNATLEHKLSSREEWIYDGEMIRTDVLYSFTISDLIPDTTYDVQITFNDPDGVRGDSVQVLSDIRMLSIVTKVNRLWATTTDTDIQVKAIFSGDANENNSARLEYKFSSESNWHDSGLMTKDTSNYFYTQTISNIINYQTYDIKVTFSDSDGIIGNPVQIINNLQLSKPTLPPHHTTIIPDGSLSDWAYVEISGSDTLIIDQINGELIWIDSPGDDVGDGGDALLADDNPAPYTYPEHPAIHGTEADIEQFRIAYDDNNFYFLVDLADSVLHSQLPLSIILIDMNGPSNGQIEVGYSTELKLGDQHSWDFEIALVENSIIITDALGNDLSDNSDVFQNLEKNLYEASILVASLGYPEGNWDITMIQTLNLSTGGDYSAIEIHKETETLHGGGGIDGDTDPDVYDLIGAKYENQCTDLSNYSDTSHSIINHSWLNVTFSYSTIDIKDGQLNDKFRAVKFDLDQNYPNPFNPTTTINYWISEEVTVDLKIFNLIGQEVRTLINKQIQIGENKVIWDGLDKHGQMVSTGIYIYRIQVGDYSMVKKLILQR